MSINAIPRVPLGQTANTALYVFRGVDLTNAGIVKGADGRAAIFNMVAPNGRLYNAVAMHAQVLDNTWSTGVLELLQSSSLDIPGASFATPVQIAKTTLFTSESDVVAPYTWVSITTAQAVTNALDLYVFLGQTP